MKKAIATLCGVLAGAWAHAPTAAQEGAPTSTPLILSKAPMLVDGKVPPPNVFLALDSGRHALGAAAAWRSAFGQGKVSDGAIRLAWQAAGQCELLPDPGPLCRGRNGLGPLDNPRRNELSAFVEEAGKRDSQESESSLARSFVNTVQSYLQQAGLDAPTADVVAKSIPPLKCRQSHLLLATPFPGVASQDPVATGAEGPDLVVRSIDTRTSKSARLISDAVDTLLAESQSVPTRTIASLAVGPGARSGSPALLYASRYDAKRWSGEVAAQLQSDGANSAPWGMREDQAQPHTSASLLDQRDPVTRMILSSTGSGATLRTIAFRWQQLAPWQQAALNDGDELGSQRLDYLRGDRSREQSRGGAFRDRDSRQADSVNSGLWHPAAPAATAQAPTSPAMLYLGANGGMLHAFSAKTGVEAFAYVPQGVYARLGLLTRPQYRHEYFVDGSPWTAEVDEAGSRKTLLAGFLGSGGRGYFVFDVGNPADWAENAPAAASAVLLDTTATDDRDIGHIVGEPVRERAEPTRTRQIARLNNGRWAMVIGNGHGSESQQAALLIQFLDGARELLKLPAGSPGGNGLSTARLVDSNGDQKPDFAYAGDLRGQLWKFDLGSSDSNAWSVSLDGRPLYAARDADGKPQPISAAPLLMPHPVGGHMVVFGTGRMLSDGDRADTNTQSIYGIHDRDGAVPVPPGRSALVQQSIEPASVGTVAGRQLWTSTDHALPPLGEETKRGWYLDLPATGERVIANPVEYEGKLVDVLSMAPPAAFRKPVLPESCEPPAILNFRTTLNALDGARPRSQLYGGEDSTRYASRIEMANGPSVQVTQGKQVRTIGFDGTEDVPRHRLGLVARRAGWRQLR